ncbi:hypothetical protein ANN_25902 [Periplaneta americana]|uniref:Uncharacterized protein n=1 Tax=Periplaneta americana TaxID=6978 RepID=A0ABQ8S4F3_PERAM|nr:hypothetical protein ANN_25902 [Periplaneta americana]
MANEAFNRKRSIFCGPLEKELRTRLVKYFVWSVALYGPETWTLPRSEEKRLEGFKIWESGGKKTFGGLRRWNNIKMDLREVEYDDREFNLEDRWRAFVRAAKPAGSLNICTWFRERHCDDMPLAGQRQIQIERSLTPVSKRVGVVGRKQEKCTASHNVLVIFRDQNIVRNGNIKIGDLSFEEVEKFKYLGATVTNINETREEIKRRINMGNACYYSVEKLLSSSLLSKNLKVRIYKTVILPVVLFGCETWTLTLREEHRLRVFENKVLRKIFGAKRDEVTGEWRKLHNTELHALYSSPDIIRDLKSRRLRWAEHVARMGESRNAYRVLVGRPEGKIPLGRPRRRWEDNIKMDLREVGYDDRDWINLAQDRDRWRAYVRAAMNLRVP